MTRVVIQSGSCGFTVTVTAERNADRTVRIELDTECEMVRAMQEDLQGLDRMAPLTGFQNNPVYRSAASRLKHVSCPVPSGILKAIEVETGMNVPRDAIIAFRTEHRS